MNKLAISAKGLAKTFGSRVVLKDINLEVKKGSVYALLGPNGAGKTTTVRILSTLTSASAGEITVAGFDVATNPKSVRSRISLTGQYAAVDEKLTGRENLVMVGELCGMSGKEIKGRIEPLLRQFALEDAADNIAGAYSGGMRRKLDLAMSLMNAPEIIFLDEPTTGLDPRSRKAMWDIIDKLRQNGVTIFLTTQYLEEADQLADMISVIDGGVVVATGTASELKGRIGGRSLRLTFDSPEEAIAAGKLFDADNIISNEPNTLDIKTDGTLHHARNIMDTLAAAHVNPADMTFRKPSLDDVFFALTGNQKERTDDR